MKYRREIDGLRALAVIPVVFFHAGIPLFEGGFVGVDVFFVISGYLITSIILPELRNGTFSIASFYERRARRILPALFFVLIVCVPFAWFWLMPDRIEAFARSLIAVAVFSSNILFWSESGYFGAATELKPLLHTWSLAVEEQFYIFYPLALMLISRFGRKFVVVGLIAIMLASLVLADSIVNFSPNATFFLLPPRAWELLIGALVAFYLASGPRLDCHRIVREFTGLLGLGLIGYAIVAFGPETPFPGRFALVPTIGAAMVILFANSQTWTGRWLGSTALVGIGLISYSTYLWHQPLFVFARFSGISDSNHGAFIALSLLSLALGVFSWRFIEQPFRRPSHRQYAERPWLVGRNRALYTAAAGSILVAITGVVLAHLASTFPTRVPTYVDAVDRFGQQMVDYAEREEVRMNCNDGHVSSELFKTCRFGMEDDVRAVDLILWGDSLVGALLHGADKEFKRRGLRGVAYLADGCPPILGLTNSKVKKCSRVDVHRAVFERIVATEGKIPVVLHGNLFGAMNASNVRIDGLPTNQIRVLEKLEFARTLLNRSGKTLVVLEQSPTFPTAAADFYIRQVRRERMDELSVQVSEHVTTLKSARFVAERVDDYIETVTFFCSETACPARNELGKLLFHDQNHLTKEHAVRFARYAFDRMTGIRKLGER